MSALFGAPARSTSKNLVEFKAGKMTLAEKRVTPDTRKGSVYVHQSDDGLMHFCWKDRKSGVVEDDLIIFPDDVEYKKVPQCTTGRVYILKFKSSSRKFFFWMQEPKTDKDEELCTKVNECLNNPPTPGSNRSNVSSSAGLPSELSNLGETDLHNLLSGMSQQQLINLLSGGNVGNLSGLLGNRRGASTRSRTPASASSSSAAPASTADSTPSSAASPATPAPAATAAETAPAAAPAVQLSDLQSILSNISVPQSAESAASSAPGGGVSVDLSSALTAETLQPVLSNPEFLERLQQFLPSIGNTDTLPPAQNLRGTLQSPQFQQALSLFSSALQSGQLAPVISQFNLGDAAVSAAAAGDLEAFVRALQSNQQPPKDDENMSTE